MHERLTKSVSVQEMLTMRDTGMTNKQIADALDVSQGTIYKAIGKMPPGLRSKAHALAATDYVENKKPEPPHTIRSALKIAARNHELRGEVLSLNVRTSDDGTIITWFGGFGDGQTVTVEQLEALRNELDDAIDAIRRVLK